ncbi:hypothetical protein VR7878_00654 [Vibrio ruber DSM 16370]|uniref:Uncharacterized protein n=1 Tax=Vibrio ruber (strain DSM 16370 / JCM 11486 / BCRC 17186 / CECT 7878 / LMG 23124 / VR1) TaxID=1123498 RepID=A0A1R4LCP5_VIBR1|nr:hypothetical protein [Vibrio ruber]SJN54163.1 hypothetical protein VR7878_00654 [Vibrio ruber DSM 16370]
MPSLTGQLAELRKYGVIGSMLYKLYQQYEAKQDANETYKELTVVLDGLWSEGYRFESKEVQAVVTLLRELPAPGARKRSFERRYLVDEYTLKQLPHDPRRISPGYWH